MPKVSVIVPIYGVEKFIERCARSLLEQTLDDIEYIFINDCTPDHSMEILQKVISDYPHRKQQIRIVCMPINSGIAAVRRHGIKLSNAEYIIHCDSDDWVDTSMYELLYNKAIEEDLDFVSCDYFNSIDDNLVHKDCSIPQGEDILSYFILQNIAVSLWNKLIKRTLYCMNDIEYPLYDMGEDYVLTIQFAINTTKIGHIARPLYYYRLNPDSISNNQNSKHLAKKWISLNKNILLISNCLKKKGLNIKYKSDIDTIIYRYKDCLIPYINENKEYRNIWLNMYPDFGIWKEKGIKNKIRYILIYLGLYPFYHKLRGL